MMAREGWAAALNVHDAAKKKAAASTRSWIMLDSTGKAEILDVDKYAIMHRVQIDARDLRIIDPLLSYPSAILVRERAIVLNLEVLLRDPYNENVIPIVEELHRRLVQGEMSGQNEIEAAEEDGTRWLPHDANPHHHCCQPKPSTTKMLKAESPFEFRALEVALEAICSFLDARATELETAAYPALDELTVKISSRNLDRVRKLKSAMTRLTAHVQKVQDELEQLLDDDNDMADLYLSRKMAGAPSPNSNAGVPNWLPASPTIGSKISRASRASAATFHGNESDVEELEMLLEAYLSQIEGTLNKLTTLREYIDDTEDYINFQIDNHRNQLIQLELFLSAANVVLTFCSLVAGIFGMNIPYSWKENHGYMFKWVVGVAGLVSVSLFIFIVSYARCGGLIGS
uniref:Magnesium transporter n=1 Tax=Elaeis guineensis var. tenera TaxID=51953 RepID=A0A6J0PKQ6_ELAGV|nr:magnesium transporter MRS2-I isoform X2 [Elaeis guineensis]